MNETKTERDLLSRFLDALDEELASARYWAGLRRESNDPIEMLRGALTRAAETAGVSDE